MKNQKSLTNKGFSLVELIIVVAIMAVLIGVLAPQYLRYVEKSRLQKDNTSIAEIADVIKMMSAEESLIEKFKTSPTDPTTFVFEDGVFKGTSTAVDAAGNTALNDELKDTIGDFDNIKISSNTYGKDADITIKAIVDPNTKVMTVTCEDWKSTAGQTSADDDPKIF